MKPSMCPGIDRQPDALAFSLSAGASSFWRFAALARSALTRDLSTRLCTVAARTLLDELGRRRSLFAAFEPCS